jgi:hypothetical protein
MSCTTALCQECATTWDGINLCAGCLARRGHARHASRSWPGLLLMATASVALLWVGSKLMVWAGGLAASLR